MVENLCLNRFKESTKTSKIYFFNMAARADMRSKLLSHSFPFLHWQVGMLQNPLQGPLEAMADRPEF